VPRLVTPDLLRRELGARLREHRKDAGFKAGEVAQLLGVSITKITRLEKGERGTTARDIRDLADIYQIDDDERERLLQLAADSRKPAPLHRAEVPSSVYMGLEASAASISDFRVDTIHGLLQTDDYARALLEAMLGESEAHLLDWFIEARRTRQRLLVGPPAIKFSTIMDEAAIRRLVGGASVMREQLDLLCDQASEPNIDMRVIPFKVGAHPALSSTFTVLQLPEGTPDVVYVEGLAGARYLESARDLARYGDVFRRLQELALTPESTVSLIRGLADSLAAG